MPLRKPIVTVNLAEATAAQNDIISGKIAFLSTGKTTGNLDLTQSDITAGDVILGKKGYNGKTLITGDVDLTQATIVAGDMLAGKKGYNGKTLITGVIPVIVANTVADSITPQNGRLYMKPPIQKYWSAGGNLLYYDSADFLEANIANGKNIFGKVGTLMPRKSVQTSIVSGSTGNTFRQSNGVDVSSVYSLSLSGLDFTPLIIILSYIEGSYEYVVVYNSINSLNTGIKEYHMYTLSGADLPSTTRNINANYGPATVYNGGFVAPASLASKTYQCLVMG